MKLCYGLALFKSTDFVIILCPVFVRGKEELGRD